MQIDSDSSVPKRGSASELLELVRESGLPGKTNEERQRLQASLNAAQVRLLNVFSDSSVDRMEGFLADLRRVASAAGEVLNEVRRSPGYYLGQLHAMAEMAEMIRRQKIPRDAAQVLVNRVDAESIARIVFAQGSIGLAQLARELGKSSQNLHAVLREMQDAGLLRRDEFGHEVLYSPTPLTRVAISWGAAQEQKTENANPIAA